MTTKPAARKIPPQGSRRTKVVSGRFVLRLYVAGQSPRSVRAIANVQKLCAQSLKGRYVLEVIDLYQRPQLAQGEQIVAVPTLVRKLPLPLRRIIGDMSDTERMLVGLDLLSESQD
jgi:circadian clock protein KaiB